MKTSAKGRKLIAQREGVRLKAYKDTKGIWTIGVGHIAQVHEGMTITQAQCDKLLAQDLQIAEDAINRSVKVSLTQDQFDALVSLTFNIGVHAFETSTCLRRLNAGHYADAASAMMMFTKQKELIPRRQGEMFQFIGTTAVGLMSQEDPSLEAQAPTPAMEPVANNAVAESNTFEELRGKLAQGADLVTKAQMAADSDVVRIGRRVVKFAVGGAGAVAAAPAATAVIDTSPHGFWSRFFDMINGVPGPVYFGAILLLITALGITAWWAAEQAIALRKAGRVIPKAES